MIDTNCDNIHYQGLSDISLNYFTQFSEISLTNSLQIETWGNDAIK